MKKKIYAVLIFCLAAGFAACSGTGESGEAGEETSTTESEEAAHKIGVLVYSRTDDEVLMFQDYLENYIESSFDEVEFVYSDEIQSFEDTAAFIETAAENDIEGIMSFITYDLVQEVSLCAKEGIYYMVASGSVAEEDFNTVADNRYFLGVVGPGSEIEYEAGYDMGTYFAGNADTDEYFVLIGGGFLGNEMHKQRTLGILTALQDTYGVTFDGDMEEMAVSSEFQTLEAGDLTVYLCPGYMSDEEMLAAAREAYAEHPCTAVMSVLIVRDMGDDISANDAMLGVIDCYSDTNAEYFNNGQISYLTGKYRSIIGPSFAAMYNAVTGYADRFRNSDGTAFQITQGFWTSVTKEDFNEKYALSSGIAMNAYSYDDLSQVCGVYNPRVSLKNLVSLAGAYTFEDAEARRADA